MDKFFKFLFCLAFIAVVDYFPASAQQSRTKVTITKESYDKDGNKTVQTIVKEGAEADSIDIEGLASGKPYRQPWSMQPFGGNDMPSFPLDGPMMYDLRSLFDSLGMGNFQFFGPEDWSMDEWPGLGGMGGLGTAHRPRLGVQIRALETQAGVTVTEVVPDSPAAAAGVLEGDIILSANETPIQEPEDLVEIVQSTMEDAIILDILRGEEHLTLEANIKQTKPRKELEERKL